MQPEIASLLVPISQENPVGNNLEYEPLFDEIRHARESDPDYLPQDEWSVTEPRKADWCRVHMLSEKALMIQSKDLQLACWYVESMYHQQGLAGLVTGISFLSEFITSFWYQCWPSIEEEGLAIRRSKLLRLDRDLSQGLFHQPMLRQKNTSLACWREILAFEHKINTMPDAHDDLLRQEGDLSMATFNQHASRFSTIEIGNQANRVEQLSTLFEELEARYTSLSQDPEGELFAQSRQTLTNLADYLQRLAQRAIPHVDDVITLSPQNNEDTPLSIDTSEHSLPPVMSRELAVSQMLVIAGYFRQTEPSSPVPFLMERAARWANMTLTEWLEEMLNDSNSINEINNVLTGHTR